MQKKVINVAIKFSNSFKNEKGLLSLEASICLTLFIFLMLFMYSYFVVFETRNVMAHALLSATDSLALDTYELGKIEESGDISQIIAGVYNTVTSSDNEFHSTNRWNQLPFNDPTDWNNCIFVPGSGNAAGGAENNSGSGNKSTPSPSSSDNNQGGGGSKDDSSFSFSQDDLSGSNKKQNIEDEFGNSGVESSALGDVISERFFAYLATSSNSKDVEAVLEKYHIVGGQDGIDFSGSRIESGNLYIVITYKIDYEFNVFDLMDITFEQSACSKLWK